MIFLEFNNVNNEKRYRYEWDGNSLKSSEIPITNNTSNSLIVGINNESFAISIQYYDLKVIFFDLGNTLLKAIQNEQHGITDIEIFDKTDELLTLLKDKGIILGIISNGSRSDLRTWLDDPSSDLSLLFNKFHPNLIVMSDEPGVGYRKPHKKIFQKALQRLQILNSNSEINSYNSIFLTEEENHFKVYNLVFAQNVKDIASYS